MREILFRGQTRRHGEKVKMNGDKIPSHWVYGGIFQGTGDYSVIYDINGKYAVYSDTVGQYTGLKASNGEKIFEGDIVRAILTRDEGCTESTRIEKGIIGYDTNGMLGLQVDSMGYGEPVWSDFFYELDMSGLILDYTFEVIGNIHDNPELLKEGAHE